MCEILISSTPANILPNAHYNTVSTVENVFYQQYNFTKKAPRRFLMKWLRQRCYLHSHPESCSDCPFSPTEVGCRLTMDIYLAHCHVYGMLLFTHNTSCFWSFVTLSIWVNCFLSHFMHHRSSRLFSNPIPLTTSNKNFTSDGKFCQ